MAAAAVTGTVLTAPYFSFNSVDLSSFVTDIKFDNEVEIFLSGASGKTGKARFSGLADHKITVTLNQSFTAATGVDQAIRASLGTAVPVKIGQSSGTASSTNPTYTFYGAVFSYNPFGDGAVGQPQKVSFEIYLADGVPATPVVT